jgi:ABC-type uncharacterized transport system involved in gliding motility auxiliary subunit
MARKSNIPKRLAPLTAFVLLFAGLVAANVLADLVPLRLDVTQDGLYTLSKGSKSILAHLKRPVTIKLYYSESLPEVPVAFKTYSRKVIELLRQYQASSNGRLTLETFDPKPDTDEEEWATRYGLNAARLPDGSSLYFGLVAIQAEREAPVPFLDPRREKFLEYDISQAVSRVNTPEKQVLGLLSSLPVQGGYPMAGGQQEWAFLKDLQRSFEVKMLYPNSLVEVPDDVKVMMVLHPKAIPDKVSYAIDQFLMRGGKLMIFVDPNSRLDPASQQRFGAPASSDLKKLFDAWGVQFDPLMVVGDQDLATRVSSPDQGVIDYPVWVTLHKDNLNHELAITSDLEEVTLIDSGAFSTTERFKDTFTPLLTSSKQSALLDFATVRMSSPSTLAQSVKPDGKQRVLAALVTGKFSTAFPDGAPPPPPPPPKKGEKGQSDPAAEEKPKHPFLAKSEQESSILLVGDADFLGDPFSVQNVNFFGNVIQQPINDNLNFVANATEFLMGSQDLIYIRSRGQFSRPFARVQALQVAASQRYMKEEQQLSTRLDEVKKKLSQIESQKPSAREKVILSPEQLAEVQKFRLEEQKTRKALRDVRRLLREDIDRLGNTLLAINLLVVPVLVALLGFVVIFRRTRRKGR